MVIPTETVKECDQKDSGDGGSLGIEIVDRAGVEKACEGEKKSMISLLFHID